MLGRSERVVPSTAFQAAFGFAEPDKSFGAIEVRADPDNVHRVVRGHIPLRGEGSEVRKLPTLANLLLAKSGDMDMPDIVRLAPKQPLESLPTYSLWDVLQCAKTRPCRARACFTIRSW